MNETNAKGLLIILALGLMVALSGLISANASECMAPEHQDADGTENFDVFDELCAAKMSHETRITDLEELPPGGKGEKGDPGNDGIDGLDANSGDRGGIAMAMAMSSIPHSDWSRNSFGLGMANYGGQTEYAVGGKHYIWPKSALVEWSYGRAKGSTGWALGTAWEW